MSFQTSYISFNKKKALFKMKQKWKTGWENTTRKVRRVPTKIRTNYFSIIFYGYSYKRRHICKLILIFNLRVKVQKYCIKTVFGSECEIKFLEFKCPDMWCFSGSLFSFLWFTLSAPNAQFCSLHCQTRFHIAPAHLTVEQCFRKCQSLRRNKPTRRELRSNS